MTISPNLIRRLSLLLTPMALGCAPEGLAESAFERGTDSTAATGAEDTASDHDAEREGTGGAESSPDVATEGEPPTTETGGASPAGTTGPDDDPPDDDTTSAHTTTGADEGSTDAADPEAPILCAEVFCEGPTQSDHWVAAPAGLVVGDLDNDGLVDLVTGSALTGELVIAYGDGVGDFVRVSVEPQGLRGARGFSGVFGAPLGFGWAVGFGADEGLYYLESSFDRFPPLTAPAGFPYVGVGEVAHVALGSLDRDTDGDAAWLMREPAEFRVWASHGQQWVTRPWGEVIGPDQGQVSAVFAELDGVAPQEWVVADREARRLVVLGLSGGKLEILERIDTGAAGIVALAAGDVDGDGLDDVVASARADSGCGASSWRSCPADRLWVWHGSDAAGSLLHAGATGLTLDPGSSVLSIADFDNDGFADLVSASSWSERVDVRSGREDLAHPRPLPLPVGGGSLLDIGTGDFNRDGAADVAVQHRSSGRVTIMLQDREAEADG